MFYGSPHGHAVAKHIRGVTEDALRSAARDTSNRTPPPEFDLLSLHDGIAGLAQERAMSRYSARHCGRADLLLTATMRRDYGDRHCDRT